MLKFGYGIRLINFAYLGFIQPILGYGFLTWIYAIKDRVEAFSFGFIRSGIGLRF
jgi:hypothetical protein